MTATRTAAIHKTTPASLALLALAAALLATALLTGPLAHPAGAAEFEYSVSTDTEYRDALTDCATRTAADECIIRVTNTLAIDADNGTPWYSGPADLTIIGIGAKHIVTAGGGSVTFLRTTGGAQVHIENLDFVGFMSTTAGGAVLNVSGTALVLQSVTMRSNHGNSSQEHGAEGGAVRVINTDLHVYDSSFTNNFADGSDAQGASGEGGAIFFYRGDIVIERSTFINNEAERSGGAVHVDSANLSIEDSTFDLNEAESGGALVTNGVATTITGSTFFDNAAGEGGAVWFDGEADIENSTFQSNSAVTGGAVYSSFDALSLTHVTLADNSASGSGANIYKYGGTTTLRATVLGAPASGSSCGMFFSGSFFSAGYNWATNTSCLTGTDATDTVDGTTLGLGPLADNGGPTWTMEPLDFSPLVDAIPLNETAPGTDQRGVARAHGAGFDIGAVEREQYSVSFDVTNSSADVMAEVTVTGASGYSDVEWFQAAGYTPAPPAGVAAPLGIFAFVLDVPWPGDSVTVTMELAQPVSVLWKDVDGTWVEVTDAVVVGSTITYELVDGGPLDSDGQANGVIVDPILAGVGASFTG